MPPRGTAAFRRAEGAAPVTAAEIISEKLRGKPDECGVKNTKER